MSKPYLSDTEVNDWQSLPSFAPKPVSARNRNKADRLKESRDIRLGVPPCYDGTFRLLVGIFIFMMAVMIIWIRINLTAEQKPQSMTEVLENEIPKPPTVSNNTHFDW